MRFRGAVAGALALLVLGACAPSTNDRSEVASETPPDSTASWPPHGGVAVALDDGRHAELIVDDTGMMFVYLFDAERRPLETEGRRVAVTVTTPDGGAREVVLAGMGRGAAAHHMNPMEEAMLAHVREQGSYAARVSVTEGDHVAHGDARVEGLATGGKGM